jgi:hypothetical protein
MEQSLTFKPQCTITVIFCKADIILTYLGMNVINNKVCDKESLFVFECLEKISDGQMSE